VPTFESLQTSSSFWTDSLQNLGIIDANGFFEETTPADIEAAVNSIVDEIGRGEADELVELFEVRKGEQHDAVAITYNILPLGASFSGGLVRL